jgi:DNA-binding NarL/FixJ family response regulator
MGSTTSSPPLRILIAGAHPLVALGLADMLHKLGYVLVGSVASGQEAILAAGEHQPDLLVIDVDLKGQMDGITAAVKIHSRLGIRSVFLAEHVDEVMQARAAKAAPVAVLDKTSSMSAIADALRAAPLQLAH